MENFQKIQTFFNGLELKEKGHKYYFNNKLIKESVSNVVSNFYKPFDLHAKSLKKAKELGVSQEEVIKMWSKKGDDACSLGTYNHNFGELYAFNRTLKPKTKQQKAITRFWGSLPKHIIPIKTEYMMLHLSYFFAGTADIILYNTKSKKFIIGDYKTNKELFKNFGGARMLTPFENKLETNFNKYQIQISLYQILFEQLGYEVESRIIIWLTHEGAYKVYHCENLTKELRVWLKQNYKNEDRKFNKYGQE